MDIFEKGCVTVLGGSLLPIVVAMPLAMRKVPRNRFYGFRTRAAVADDSIWFGANAHFGRRLIAASAGSALAALPTHLFRPFAPAVFLPVSIFLLAVPGLIAAVATARHLRNSKPHLRR
jgi:hypothetical protein